MPSPVPGIPGDRGAAHHFNYEIQCYINHGRVMGCFHPDSMRGNAQPCCDQWRFRGMTEHAAVQKKRTERALANIERIGRGLAPR